MSDELNLDTPTEVEFDLSSAIDSISLGLGESHEQEPTSTPTPPGNAPVSSESKPEETKSDLSPVPPPTEEVEEPSGAPVTWRKEAKEAWSALPPVVQAEIAKREEDMLKGITSYKGKAELGDVFGKTLSPHLAMLQYHQIDPVQHVSGLLDMYQKLATGSPEEKARLYAEIGQTFSIDPTLAESLAPAYVDPSILALQKEIADLKSSRQAEVSSIQAQHNAKIESEVNAFAADPANIYFDELTPDMEKLLKSGVASNIKDAYTKAVRLSDSVQAKEKARVEAENAKLAVDKVNKAKQATATNLHTNAKSGVTSTSPLGSMEDTMRETLAAMKTRT